MFVCKRRKRPGWIQGQDIQRERGQEKWGVGESPRGGWQAVFCKVAQGSTHFTKAPWPWRPRNLLLVSTRRLSIYPGQSHLREAPRVMYATRITVNLEELKLPLKLNVHMTCLFMSKGFWVIEPSILSHSLPGPIAPPLCLCCQRWVSLPSILISQSCSSETLSLEAHFKCLLLFKLLWAFKFKITSYSEL